MTGVQRRTVWEMLHEFALSTSGSFTSPEVISWFDRHAPGHATDQTIRVHVRGASWNVGERGQLAHREPFLTRVDRGLYRRATADELDQWRSASSAASRVPATVGVEGESTSSRRLDRRGEVRPHHSEEWHTEANVQAAVVTALAGQGWRIMSVANTATKARGVDVVASLEGAMAGIEVKGFPSRRYADPARAGETKRTRPSTQAGHWYAEAVLAAMRLRGREPAWRSVVALPDFPRYRALHSETIGSLDAARIEMWWIDHRGTLLIL